MCDGAINVAREFASAPHVACRPSTAARAALSACARTTMGLRVFAQDTPAALLRNCSWSGGVGGEGFV